LSILPPQNTALNPDASKSAPPESISHRSALAILLLLTLLAAAVRFQHLDRPPLLIDECFTFWRTCGTYSDLVDTLRDDGFVPLHYELLWWLKQGLPLGSHFRIFPHGLFLTPTVMRFLPALFGTLMVPIIYFVSRQLFDRKTSLLAAAFVACSAYAIFFSRDAKMYSPTWTLGALATGCLMWWLRTGRSTAWLAWVAAGAAAAGVHVVTLLLLAIAPIYLLTQKRIHWRQSLLLVAGAALILAGPMGYYLTFNRWTEKSGGLVPGVTSEPAPDANWQASGLNWIPQSDSGSATFETLSSYLIAYEWNGTTDAAQWLGPPTWMRPAIIATVTAILGLLLLGLLPWPKNWTAHPIEPIDNPEPKWRAALWLLCWIVIPAYGFFYCRSYEEPDSPKDWLIAAAGLWGRAWPWLVPTTILLAAAATHWRRVAIALGAITALTFILIPTLFALGAENFVQKLASARSFQCFAVACFPAAIWVYSAATNRQRLGKLFRMTMVVALILLICSGACAIWNSLRDESEKNASQLPWQTIWHTRYIGIVWPAIWIAAAALILRLPTRPLRILAILFITAANLTNGVARYLVQTQVPYDRVFADIWLAQPGAKVRTYFDLNGTSFFGEAGLPVSEYWRPMVAYNANLAARHSTNPTDFRTGKTWPFNYGPMMTWFESAVVYRPYTDSDQIKADVSNSPGIQRIIIWKMETGMPIPAAQTQKQLGPQWQLIHDEQINQYWYWTWQIRPSFRRLEFARVSTATQN
jgi:hypothetical protein